MALTDRLKNQHLLWRSAFGPMAENAAALDSISQKELWKLLLKTSATKPEKINVAQNLVDGFFNGVSANMAVNKKDLDVNQRKQLRQQSQDDLKNLNLRWMNEMINSEAQLREKTALFWHGHFACRVINSFYQQDLLQIIRENALGNFGDLLRAVSKSPSMLQFLNNQQNKKQHPNENFAREVMELFTLGRGNYTENDIKESARAFTGWGFNPQGEFVFRQFQHDKGEKTILGSTGDFDGDAVIDILLKQKQTAKFITQKIYKFYVNEELDAAEVSRLSTRFYDSGYDIKKLLEDIFTSENFYAEKNVGNKIKSPVELLVGIRRLLPMELENDKAQLFFQKTLGQILFYPPNVAGWPGGKYWIDSSTLMIRLRIPQIITANESLNIRPKTDDDVNMGMMQEEKLKKVQQYTKGATAVVDWPVVSKIFEATPREQLLQKISETVLQTKSKIDTTMLGNYLNNENRENFVKSAVINLMCTPEYQLS